MNKIRDFRKKFGYSQQKLATLLGDDVTQTAISQWESGKTRPRPDRVRQLAAIFETTEADIMGITPPPSIGDKGVTVEDPTDDFPVLTLSEEERLIVQHFRGADAEGRKTISAIAELEYLRRREKLLNS